MRVLYDKKEAMQTYVESNHYYEKIETTQE